MNFRRIIAAAAAVICAAGAVSCGKKVDDGGDSVVLNMGTTTAAPTEENTTSATEGNTTTEALTEASSEETASSETTEAQTETTTTVTETETTTQEPTEAVTEPLAPAQLSFSMADLGKDAASFVAALGTPLDVQTAAGCLSNGADQKIYSYSGLDLSCYILDGKEYIYDITITGTGFATAEGISVGSTRAEAEAAYGQGFESGRYVIYEGSNATEMSVEYNGDAVVSICFNQSV